MRGSLSGTEQLVNQKNGKMSTPLAPFGKAVPDGRGSPTDFRHRKQAAP
jgi:hypothetical protein